MQERRVGRGGQTIENQKKKKRVVQPKAYCPLVRGKFGGRKIEELQFWKILTDLLKIL